MSSSFLHVVEFYLSEFHFFYSFLYKRQDIQGVKTTICPVRLEISLEVCVAVGQVGSSVHALGDKY